MRENTKTSKTRKSVWSSLSGDKPMKGFDWMMLWILCGMIFVLFLVIHATRPPQAM